MADPTRKASAGWRDPASGAPPGDRPASRRGRRIFLTLAALLAVAGAIVGFVLYIQEPPNPVFLALWITQYTDPAIPPIPYGEQDRAALATFRWQENNAFNSQEKERLLGELKRLGKEPPPPAVAVYLSGYLVTDGQGRPCLLPADARLDGEVNWLPMSEVLDALGACKTKHKLLILDVTHPLIDPRRGLLLADAAERLRPLLDEATAKDKSLLVFCAASPGQTALGSEELGQSVFGYYVRLGLLGAANGYAGTSGHDRRITARDLAAFVTARVDRWAEQNRAARQTPRLLGGGADFELVTCKVPFDPPEDAAVPEAYPEWLLDGWKLRDEWRAVPAGRWPPRRRRELDNVLLATDAAWRGRDRTERLEGELADRLSTFRARGPDNAAAPPAGRPRSLAEVVARGTRPPEAGDEDVARYRALAAKVPAPGAKPDDPGRAAYEAQRGAFLKGFEKKPFELAWFVVDRAAAEREPSRALVLLWGELLPPEGATAEYREVRALRRLADLARSEAVKSWPAAAVADAIHVARDGARLEAAPPWTRPWLNPPPGAGDDPARRREKALDLLPDANAAPAEAAAQLAASRKEGEELLRQLDDLRAAARARDEALDLLPGLGPHLAADPALERPWVEAAGHLQEVQRLLAAGQPGPNRGHIGRVAADLDERLGALRAPFDRPRWAEVAAEPRKARPGDATALAALLASPAPDATRRAALWQAYRKAAAQLWQEARAHDQADDQEGRRKDARPAPDPGPAVAEERRRGLFRARMAIELLKADGLPDAAAGPLEGAYAAAAAPGRGDEARDSAWRTLSEELRKATRAVPAAEAGRP